MVNTKILKKNLIKKILNLKEYKDLKSIKNIKNDRNLILKIFVKSKIKILKIYDRSDASSYHKEILGYKYFKKYHKFRIPKIYKTKKNKFYNLLELAFIEGKNASLFSFYNILPLLKVKKKRGNFKKYINKFYHKKYIKNKIIKYISENSNEIYFTNSHGDFASYNLLKTNKNYYIFDFEKFSHTSLYYDQINFISHLLFYNFSKFTILLKHNVIQRFLITCFNYFIIKFVFFLFIKVMKYENLSFVQFKNYFFFYLLTKISSLRKDLESNLNKKEKLIVKQSIITMDKILINI